MAYFILAIALLVTGRLFVSSEMVVWVLLASQLALLGNEVRSKQVSGVGGFIFMSVLFFGMRPLYMTLENDRAPFANFFLIRVDSYTVGDAMWWATLALIAFSLAAHITPFIHRKWIGRRAMRSRQEATTQTPTLAVCLVAVVLQCISLPVMFYIASLQRSVYRSDLGAYLYDLPMPLQAIHVVAVVWVAGRFQKLRDLGSGVLLAVSVALLLAFTWLMRDVSIFRGFYLSGLIVAGLAFLHQMKPRVGYAWLIIPIIVGQPLFGWLGAERRKSNEELAEVGALEEIVADESLIEAYWNFYSSGRDMNIFDTFVAAKASEPRFYPYAWSWFYVPFHWIPRQLWEGKPKQGITQDMKFNRGAPLSPGIAGFFLLDGGLLWMLGSMALLGYLMSLLDASVLTLARGSLRSCLIGIVVVNGMFLTRLLLWQYVYQMMYMAFVVVALGWLFRKLSPGSTKLRSHHGRVVAPQALDLK